MTKLLFQPGRRSLLRSRALVGALPSPVLGLTCRSPFQVHFREAYHVEGCASCRTRLSPQTLDLRPRAEDVLTHMEILPLLSGKRTLLPGWPVSAYSGGLNGSMQHFILKRKDGV